MSAGKEYDFVSHQVAKRTASWPAKAKALFQELLEDARTELQREFLRRAVVAEHSLSEIHAFADAMRPLSDAEAFARCSLDARTRSELTLEQSLLADADPLWSYQLKGGKLDPRDDSPSTSAPETDLPNAPIENADFFTTRIKEIGASNAALPSAARGAASPTGAPEATEAQAASGGRFFALLEDLVNEASGPLGVVYREHDVDTPQGSRLEDLLPHLPAALNNGIPIPLAIGPTPGHHRRFALILQLSVSGKNRAFQIYEPISQEVAWVNEGDLLMRNELPFAERANRRVTRLALPVAAP